MVINGLSDTINRTIDRMRSSMVFDRRTDGDLCGSSDPHCDNGWSAGSRQVGDCSMVTPELEENVTVDEILSDICSITADGDYISGYLRFSLKGTP